MTSSFFRRWLAPVALAFALAACGGGHHDVAVNTGPKALPPANPAAVGKMVQGVGAAKEGQRERSVVLFREAIAIDPNLWEARFNLGIVLASAGDLATAEEELKQAHKLAPEMQDVVVALAEVERRRGQHKDAAELLTDFVNAHPLAVEARTLLVGALRNSGQVEKAIVQAREVLVRKPGDAQALAELALCHLAKGEKDTAQLLAKQAMDANPKSALAHRAMGLIHLASGDDALAFQEFLRATQEDPRDTTARLNMGSVLLRAGAYAKAEDQYRAILQVSADDIDAQVGLAAAIRAQADAKSPARLEEARGMLTKVLEKDPHNISALFNLGVIYADFLKKPGDALPLFKRFLSDAPSDHPARADAEKYVSATSSAADKPPTPPPDPKKGGK